MDKTDGYKMHRSTSLRLRKRRDQAKKEFLKDRRSGEFGYDTHHDGWSYVSFQPPGNAAQIHTSGPVSLSVKPIKNSSNPTAGGPRSLGFLPSMSTAAQQTDKLARSDTEDCVRTRRKTGRCVERTRERRLWRRSAFGLGEEEMKGRMVYTDFGMIDKFETKSEMNIVQCNKQRSLRQERGVLRESTADWRQEMLGQVDQVRKLGNIPVNLQCLEKQNEQFPLLKGLLWQKKDRIFSRWKQRFFVLTLKHLQCFSKCPERSKDFLLFQVDLSSIEKMDLTEKKGYLTIALTVHKEGKILMRSSLGIREWFLVIKRCCKSTLEQKSTEEFWSGRLQRESDNIDAWLLGRQGLGIHPGHHTSTPAMVSLHNHSVPTLYQTEINQASRQPDIWSRRDTRNHHIWSHQDTHQQIYSEPKMRRNSEKHKRRPKSILETNNDWDHQPKERPSNTKHDTNKDISDPKSEDSGNSSLSTSTRSSRRK